jgi:hypothetical protein
MFFSRIREVERRTVEKSTLLVLVRFAVLKNTLLVLVRIDDSEKQVKWNGL